MTRTIVDIPDGKLDQAMKALGTTTKVATVNQALDLVIAQNALAEMVEWIADGGLPDLEALAQGQPLQ
jgi:Arc/MetJ family transcription regulator